MQILFTAEYLQAFDLYMVVPIVNGKELDEEYMFVDETAQLEFMDYYRRNPVAACFAYSVKVNAPWLIMEVVHV